MSLASRQEKSAILLNLKNTSKKYSKPFDQGKMAQLSIMGGDWEQYAQIITQMISADTLLDVQQQLETLNANIVALTRAVAGTCSGTVAAAVAVPVAETVVAPVAEIVVSSATDPMRHWDGQRWLRWNGIDWEVERTA